MAVVLGLGSVLRSAQILRTASLTDLGVPSTDKLAASGAAAESMLDDLVESCEWSPESTQATHAALTHCQLHSSGSMASPIPPTAEVSVPTDTLPPFLEGTFRYAGELTTSRDGETKRELRLNSAAGGAYDGLTSEFADGATTWSEFRSDEPMWSSRSDSEPWSTREEPGAFEPPYRFAFFGEAAMPTVVASSAGVDPVFEAVVDDDGTELLQFCIDSAAGLTPSPHG